MFAPLDPLLAPSRLAALLDHPDPARRPVVLDVRWRLTGPPARPDHDAAHIPGAVFLDMDTDLADPPGPAGRHPLPSVERLQAALRRAGVRDGSLVVAHDDAQGVQAARAWWLLRWAGFAAGTVAVLDGGYRAWVEAGLPTTAESSRPAPGDVTVRPGGMPVLDADEAAALARSGVLLDARAPERYRGEHEPIDPKAGHIPGARNAPATDVLGPDGRWLPPAALAEWLSGLAEAGEGEVGAYCGSGATATALVLAAEHAGFRPPDRPIELYVGSWSNWSADPQRPVATGAAP
ncbi:sulfurtransferase [Pseudonocardia zijingensis]|uniref:Sulfurtransferase n=1 Tax=Pseudonocardia zijingensis TaxID=153376 RepID=A0ABP4AJB1_9PSEU